MIDHSVSTNYLSTKLLDIDGDGSPDTFTAELQVYKGKIVHISYSAELGSGGKVDEATLMVKYGLKADENFPNCVRLSADFAVNGQFDHAKDEIKFAPTIYNENGADHLGAVFFAELARQSESEKALKTLYSQLARSWDVNGKSNYFKADITQDGQPEDIVTNYLGEDRISIRVRM